MIGLFLSHGCGSQEVENDGDHREPPLEHCDEEDTEETEKQTEDVDAFDDKSAANPSGKGMGENLGDFTGNDVNCTISVRIK